MITFQNVIDEFIYQDGKLMSKQTNKDVGTISQHMNKRYKKTWVNGKYYYIHRLIYLMHHKKLPRVIDHINGDSLDNRIENLREVTVSQNLQNTKKRVTNKSGYKGVSWNKERKKWVAQITINNKVTNLGGFDDPKKAYEAYQFAASKMHTVNPEARAMS